MKKMSKTTKHSGTEPIVFFGSGPVAAASLTFLVEYFPIEVVVTKAVPAHHKQKAPVEEVAKTRGLRTLFANVKTELDDLIKKEKFKSRLGVIVDYGVIVSDKTINSFELGIVNSHFSLLPRWRGADPISFAILEGDAKTGVSLMLIEPELDTGKILVQKSLKIEPDDTTPKLTEKLIELSNHLLAEYLPLYMSGKVKARSQPHPNRATYSRKLTKEDGLIDWTKPAEQIEHEIKAYSGWPKSRTNLADIEVIITQAHVDESAAVKEDCKPGQAWIEDKQIKVQACDKPLIIDRLKPAGKPEMTAQAFLAGYKIF